MVLRVQALEAFARNQRIDLRRGKAAVAEQHLQRAQVGAVVEQVRGEAVAQAVRADPRRVDARAQRQLLHRAPELLAAERLALARQEQRLELALAGQLRPRLSQ